MLLSRRTFLGQTAVGLLGLSLARCAKHEITPLTGGLALPFLTPVGEHYVKNGAEGSIAGWREPDLAAEAWSLTLDGLVDTPLTVTLADLQALDGQAVSVLKTMQCVVDSGTAQGLVGTALWRGIPLRLLLDRAGADRVNGKRIHVFGADGFTNNLPLGRIYDPAALEGLVGPLLVTHMNGAPLTRRHGAPVRLLVPDGFGYASVKWIRRIEVTADDRPFGTYQDTGFTDESTSPVFSKITAPTDNLRVPAGTVVCHGFATSGHAGVDRVECRLNGGPWLPATLATPEDVLAGAPEVGGAAQLADPGRFGWPCRAVWALWTFAFDAEPGRYRLEVRAIDRAGNAQPERDLEISDGVNAIAAVRMEVV
ncbi:MAG: molybdopterin-dependent oxidoreductase [Myxococcales bacterium]|nr:molybdopterin-dependent oxidoreductase [Myxococcales bacterium]